MQVLRLAAKEECATLGGLCIGMPCTDMSKKFYFDQVQILLNGDPSKVKLTKRYRGYFSLFYFSILFDHPNICKLLLLAGTDFHEEINIYGKRFLCYSDFIPVTLKDAISVAITQKDCTLRVLLDWRKEKGIAIAPRKYDLRYCHSVTNVEMLLDHGQINFEETWHDIAVDPKFLPFMLNRLSKLSVHEQTRIFNSLKLSW